MFSASIPSRFQSLFWWKYCPGQDRDGFSHASLPRFQSLFWWKYCPGLQLDLCGQFDAGFVSILVLVEVLPWVYSSARIYCFAWSGFNPCSGGSIALGKLILARRALCRAFQSLFWWKYCPGSVSPVLVRTALSFQSLFWWKYCPGVRPYAGICLPWQFQSLFWWKYCPGKVTVSSMPCIRKCFNPCSGGSIALGGERRG